DLIIGLNVVDIYPSKTVNIVQPSRSKSEIRTVSVDGGSPIQVDAATCDVDLCFASITASTQLIEQMKSGRTLVMHGIGADGKPVRLTFPLEGFAAVYAGPARRAGTWVHYKTPRAQSTVEEECSKGLTEKGWSMVEFRNCKAELEEAQAAALKSQAC